MDIEIIYKAKLSGDMNFTVGWENYYYTDDACCQSIVRKDGSEYITIRETCIYNPENNFWKYPEFMDEVYKKLEECKNIPLEVSNDA